MNDEKKMTAYKVLSGGIQVQYLYGYKRFKKDEIIKLDPEHPLTQAFLRGHIIELYKPPKRGRSKKK